MSHIPIACFCNPSSVETIDHLFFSCPLAQAVLSWLQSLIFRCSALIPPLLCRHVLFGLNSDELCVVPRGFVGVLGLISERMDQNLGKIRGASNIAELQKITLPGTAHILRKASVH